MVSQKKRFKKAASLVVGLFLVVACSAAVGKVAQNGLMQKECVQLGSSLIGSFDIQALMQQEYIPCADYIGRSGSAFWQTFEQEVTSLASCGNVRIAEPEGVVGCVFETPSALVQAQMENDLAEHGWIKAGGGAQGVLSFVKQDGVFRWLVVEFYEIGTKACVVMQVM